MIHANYKEVVNYLRNELGIGKEYIGDLVEKIITNQVRQAIEQRLTESRLKTEIAAAVFAVTTNRATSYYNTRSSEELFRDAVLNETRKAVGKLLENELGVIFKIQPKV